MTQTETPTPLTARNLALDVLAQLEDDPTLVPQTGGYLERQYQRGEPDTIFCAVCALGGGLVALSGLGPDVAEKALGARSSVVSDGQWEKLVDLFGTQQLARIEYAFEGRDSGIYASLGALSDSEEAKATEWCQRYPDSRARYQAIWQNIWVFGSFQPERAFNYPAARVADDVLLHFLPEDDVVVAPGSYISELYEKENSVGVECTVCALGLAALSLTDVGTQSTGVNVLSAADENDLGVPECFRHWFASSLEQVFGEAQLALIEAAFEGPSGSLFSGTYVSRVHELNSAEAVDAAFTLYYDCYGTPRELAQAIWQNVRDNGGVFCPGGF